MTNTPITSAQSKEFDISKCLVYSNDGKSKKDISPIISDFYYYESILSPNIKANLMYVETGKTVEKDSVYLTLLEGLPVIGTERVEVILKDAKDTELKFTMYVDNVKPLYEDTTKTAASLNLVSKEAVFNYKTVLNKRFDGRVSDTVKTILTDFLKVDQNQKKLDIEETSNNYNFIGNNKRPFFSLLWLAKKSVPNIKDAKGNTAGFFFYETSEGFKFKSVDGLLSDTDPKGGKKKYKSLVYNNTPDDRGASIPPEYNGKILEYSIDTATGNVQSKLEIGAYSTRTILFDPFNCYYEVINANIKDGKVASEDKLQKAAIELPKYNPEFDRKDEPKRDFTRTQYMLIDSGSLPTGNTEQQIKNSKEENFNARDILNQSTMRYNQMFSSRVTITIVGDFSFHAGDYVYIDTPQLSDKKTQGMNEQFGGFYVISDLCHYISLANGGYTKLTLVRDSIGRKGSPIPL